MNETFDYKTINPTTDKPPKVITFWSQKGGSGKSTLAYTLSISLKQFMRVLIIDFDPQGSITSLCLQMGSLEDDAFEDRKKIIKKKNIAVCISLEDDIHDHVVPINPNLDLVPSYHLLQKSSNMSHHLLKMTIEPIVDEYDVVIIDCPGFMGGLVSAATFAADIVVSPVVFTSYQNYDSAMSVRDYWIDNMLPHLKDRWRLLPNYVRNERNRNEQYALKWRLAFPGQVLNTYVEYSPSLNRSQDEDIDFELEMAKNKAAILKMQYLIARVIVELNIPATKQFRDFISHMERLPDTNPKKVRLRKDVVVSLENARAYMQDRFHTLAEIWIKEYLSGKRSFEKTQEKIRKIEFSNSPVDNEMYLTKLSEVAHSAKRGN
jgi:chromosome partitioning protein